MAIGRRATRNGEVMPAIPQEREPGLARPALDEADLEPTGAWARLVPGITFGDFFTRGIVAGLGAGLVFILIETAWLDGLGKPAVAPLLVIATIFNGTDAPTTIPAQVPVDAMVGFVVHLNLAIALGIGFLPIVALLARLRRINLLTLVVAGLAYGCALYVVNFVILANLFWPAFTAAGSPQFFFFWVHALYGLLLVPFFVGMVRQLRPQGERWAGAQKHPPGHATPA